MKKADRLRLLPGVGGTCARLRIVLSDKDGRASLLAIFGCSGEELSLLDEIIVSSAAAYTSLCDALFSCSSKSCSILIATTGMVLMSRCLIVPACACVRLIVPSG